MKIFFNILGLFFASFLLINTFVSAAEKRTLSKRYTKMKVQKPIKKIVSNNPKKIVLKEEWSYILAAHPDDEVLCCGNVLQKILTNGGKSKVVIFTNGDHGHKKEYGQRRKIESITALKKIGINKDDIIFLGFPDGSLHDLSNKKTLKSNTTHTTKNLEHILERLFLEFPPKELFLPSQKDLHLDHKVVGSIGKKLWNKNKYEGSLFFYQIHGRDNFELATPKNQNKKWEWLQIFKSQFHTQAHKKFLYQFSVWREYFTTFD